MVTFFLNGVLRRGIESRTRAIMEISASVRPAWVYRFGRREYDLSSRTYIMGILNVTPDSFSDGGKYFSIDMCNRARSSTNKANLKLLEQQRDGELQALMSAEQYAEYRLRSSPSANLAAELREFAASENEMREIARIQEKFRAVQRTTENQERQKAELVALLGEQRAEDFDLALKSDYRDTCLVVHRYKLPPQTARDVYAVRTAALEQGNRVRADASLSREQKLALLGAIRAEAERSLVGTLGEDAFNAYSSRFSGNWLSQLEYVKR